jgi:hypothetical protein
MPRQKPVCAECGSDHVRADAYAVWDIENQQWQLSATFDKGSVCETCESDECRIEWVDVDQDEKETS